MLGQACDMQGHLPQRFEMLLATSVRPEWASMPDCAWNMPLQGHRAQRIEMLLLHEFHARKFLLPDKLTVKVRCLRQHVHPLTESCLQMAAVGLDVPDSPPVVGNCTGKQDIRPKHIPH